MYNKLMIYIDLYFQFLPHWAGPLIINNLEKTLKIFNINIKETYHYPNLISLLTSITIDNNWSWEKIIIKNTIPKNIHNKDEFFQNLKDKYKTFIIEIYDDFYIIKKHYNIINDLIHDIVNQTFTKESSYPKNIHWSFVGNYTLPRPCTGYGYHQLNEKPVILQGHSFPIDQYYNFDLNNLMNNNEKIELLQAKCNNFHQNNSFNLSLIINNFYDPHPLMAAFNNYNLPKEILASCLKNHNEGFLIDNNHFLIFIHGKKNNFNINNIIQEYQDTINIRMKETHRFLSNDQQYDWHYWQKNLEKIMFYENKINMSHKQITIKSLLKYIFTLMGLSYNNQLIEEISWYLLDLNTKIVQEFNDLQGFMASYLLPFTQDDSRQCIYDFFQNNNNNLYSVGLRIANNIYDSMMMLGLGALMTPHKDPYNLKGIIDQWLQLLIDHKITINYHTIINLFNEQYEEKFLWKQTIQSINNRWILKVSLVNNDYIGYKLWKEFEFFNKIEQFHSIQKRLKGLIKKNSNTKNNDESLGIEDQLMIQTMEKLKLLNKSQDNFYENLYYWFQESCPIIENYLDNVIIKGNSNRENLLKIIHNQLTIFIDDND